MKLNADIIHQNLRESLPVTFTGEAGSGLSLLRPEFYLESSSDFLDDHVYVCSADHLPKTPRIGRNVLLVCIGDAPELAGFRDRCGIISVPSGENIFRVFNLVQSVFNKFESWEERMNGLLRTGASLSDMLEQSGDVFENPMLLIGSDFNYLAHTESDYLSGPLGLKLDGPSFDADAMAKFLSLHDIATDIKEPLLLNLMGRSTLSVNIFDQDEYLGCITVFGEYREIRPSDPELCVYFAQMLKQAIQRDPLLAGERAALRRAVRDVVSGQPQDPEHSRLIGLNNHKESRVCALFRPVNDMAPMPSGYVASLVENRFPDSLAFEIGGHVAALIVPGSEAGLKEFCSSMQMNCGISQPFTDLYDARSAFGQAAGAMKNGLQKQAADPPYDAAGNIFFFEDYLLDQLLANAVGETPVRFFFPEGLKRLAAHDLSSEISYIETLRIYLNNNMSIARTAREMTLHRSSLIDRLARIDQLLGCDLADPDTRLTLQIALRAAELQPGD